MSMRSSLVFAVAFGLVVASAHAAFAQPTPLTLRQVQAVSRCQDSLDREGRTFVRKVQDSVEGCIAAKLAPVLKADNGLITPARFDADNDRATQTCNRLLSGVAPASTRFIDAVIRACGPVEALVMAPDPPPAGDPLGLVDLWGVSTIEEVAGLVCGESVAVAFLLAEGKAPRGFDIILNDPDISPSDLDVRCALVP